MTKTKLFAVAGKPILHSKSPNIFNAEFKLSNTDAVYSRMAADSGKEILFLTKEIGIKGLNITAPFKEEIIPLIDEIDKHAKGIGAVNTIKLKNNKVYGTNTDFLGVIKSLKNKNIDINNKKVVVLGAGGAAKAAVYGLKLKNASITLINRTINKGETLANEFNINFKPLNELNNELKNADIFISTPPSSLDLITPDSLSGKPVVLDANYKFSTLIQMANKAGCTTIDGLQWLLFQAVSGYRFMVEKEPNIKGLEIGIKSTDNFNTVNNISLCGFMASGKTLIGKSLSRVSGLSFVDTDLEIEKKENLTISEIFEKYGENHFRKLETTVINNILKSNHQLVSLGGGAVLSLKNRKTIKQHSRSIWLFSDVNSTVSRIKDSTRPLLKEDNINEKAKDLLDLRKAYYAKTSDLIINTSNATRKNIHNFSDRILFELESFSETKKLLKNSITISPSKLKGELCAPTSKSFTQRMIAIAILADGVSTINNPTYCDDVNAAIGIAKSLGIKVKAELNKIKLTNSENRLIKTTSLNCQEAGLSLRMFSAIVSLYEKKFTLSGEGSLLSRPISMVEQPLKQLGVEVKSKNGFLPITIKGPIKGGKITVDGSISSQFLTGLLIALPLAINDTEIEVNNLKSTPYIDLTLDLMKKTGINVANTDYKSFSIKGNQSYNAININAEGDWSGAAMLIVAGAIAGEVKLNGLDFNGTQGDIKILEAVENTGATVLKSETSVIVKTKANLLPFNFDATNCPDLFPPLVALAANCNGISKIIGVRRLKHKESNRGIVLQQEFAKLNIKIELQEDIMLVHGGLIAGGEVYSHNDHRIAMALGIAGLNAENKVTINNKSCITKSYPDFFKNLEQLGGIIDE